MGDPEQRNILWIDDDPQSIMGSCAELGFAGHKVVVEPSVFAVGERLQEQRFDLVIVDFCLSRDRQDSLGGELVEQLKKGAFGVTNADTPFLMVTGYADRVDLDRMRSVDGFLGLEHKAGPLTPTIEAVMTRLVTLPGLADLNGRPLRSDSDAGKVLVSGFKSVTLDMWETLAAYPELLQALRSREFEEVIAEAFHRNGFQVTLTPQTRDRGVDIYAAQHTGLGTLLFVIECKRHSADNPVPPRLVRELRGVVDRERASCGVLVTSSTFTRGAYEEQQTTEHRLALKDLEDVARWMRADKIFP